MGRRTEKALVATALFGPFLWGGVFAILAVFGGPHVAGWWLVGSMTACVIAAGVSVIWLMVKVCRDAWRTIDDCEDGPFR